jgi:hypothetical protein
MAVYLIQAGESGAIKIGSANNVSRRLQMLQTGSPIPLLILHVFDGGKAEEKSLHAKFSQYRLCGEWFSPDSSLVNGDVGLPLHVLPTKREPKRHAPFSLSDETKEKMRVAQIAAYSDPAKRAVRLAKFRISIARYYQRASVPPPATSVICP